MSLTGALSELGRLGVALVLLVVAFVALAVLLGLGPLGWFLLAVVVLAIAVLNRPLDDDEPAHLQMVNCPNCGARLDADAERCDHCDEPL